VIAYARSAGPAPQRALPAFRWPALAAAFGLALALQFALGFAAAAAASRGLAALLAVLGYFAAALVITLVARGPVRREAPLGAALAALGAAAFQLVAARARLGGAPALAIAFSVIVAMLLAAAIAFLAVLAGEQIRSLRARRAA
jgi:hypothetical protein